MRTVCRRRGSPRVCLERFPRSGALALLGLLAALALPVPAATATESEGPALAYEVEGTGRIAGHVATLRINNPGGAVRQIALPPSLIPPGEGSQGYLIPDPVRIDIAAGAGVILLLEGFSTDIQRPPAPHGESLPLPDAWIASSPPPPVDKLPVGDDGPYLPAGTRPQGMPAPTVPGTERVLQVAIDLDRHPAAAAPFLFAAVTRIAEAYERLAGDGRIETPLSGNPEREREMVVQQTLAIFAAGLGNRTYTREQFQARLQEEYEEKGGRPIAETPSPVRDWIEKEAGAFWETFERIGAEAKVLKKSPGRR